MTSQPVEPFFKKEPIYTQFYEFIAKNNNSIRVSDFLYFQKNGVNLSLQLPAQQDFEKFTLLEDASILKLLTFQINSATDLENYKNNFLFLATQNSQYDDVLNILISKYIELNFIDNNILLELINFIIKNKFYNKSFDFFTHAINSLYQVASETIFVDNPLNFITIDFLNSLDEIKHNNDSYFFIFKLLKKTRQQKNNVFFLFLKNSFESKKMHITSKIKSKFIDNILIENIANPELVGNIETSPLYLSFELLKLNIELNKNNCTVLNRIYKKLLQKQIWNPELFLALIVIIEKYLLEKNNKSAKITKSKRIRI